MVKMVLRKIKKSVKDFIEYRRVFGATGDSWKSCGMPEEQLKGVVKELEALHRGNPPTVYTSAAEALKVIPGSNKLTLLEAGCASGYYSEVISILVGERFEYTGGDYSEAMVSLAQNRYPKGKFLKLDIRCIELPDKSYDVVFSGAVLIHVKEWKMAIRELARTSRTYLILHRTPVSNSESRRREKKIFCGVPVFYNTFNKDELMKFISECGFRKIFEKNVYPNQAKGLGVMTYVFERS